MGLSYSIYWCRDIGKCREKLIIAANEQNENLLFMRRFIRFLVRNIPRPVLIRFSYAFAGIISLFYRGNKYACPICGGSFRKMLPYGNQGAENRLCPKCLSLERHRMLWLYISRHTQLLQSETRILHIAPEQSLRRILKKTHGASYVTADLKSPIADLHFDVMHIPLPDNSYDVIFCNHVLEHVENDITAMKELYRILIPGGWAVMQVPLNPNLETTYEDFSITSPAEREKVFGQYDHVRWHGRDYPDRLRMAGFVVEEFDPLRFYSTDEMDYFRIDVNEKMFIARK